MRGTIPALHALTNDLILADPGFVRSATAVMQACRTRVAIHLRSIDTPARRLLELALELRVIGEMTGSWVLINDRVDIAIASGVTGAQLTSRSLTIEDARRIAPRIVIGASVHETATAWMTAQSGATFLVAGARANAAHPAVDPMQFLADVVEAADGCPVVAVGGMTPERVHHVSRTGAAGVAAMRGIWLEDAVTATRRYLAAYDEGFRQ